MDPFSRFFVGTNVALYKWSGGKLGGTMQGAPILLLTTVGRKSGNTRTTPLIYQGWERPRPCSLERRKRRGPILVEEPPALAQDPAADWEGDEKRGGEEGHAR